MEEFAKYVVENERYVDTGVVGIMLLFALGAIILLYRNSTKQYESHLNDLKEMFKEIINKLNGGK